ncbi:MAG: sensor histidine kinase [Acidobacteriota bacterium]
MRLTGLLTCVVAGLPVWAVLVRHPEHLTEPNILLWIALVLVNVGSFWLVSSCWVERRSKWIAWTLLAIQTASALGMTVAVANSLHGVLLVIIAAVAAEVLPLRWALTWLFGQTALMAAILLPSQGPVETATVFGAFLGFELFALHSTLVALRERQAREELVRAHGELLSTRRLLGDTSRAAERLRISRELHDVMGHRLTALSLNLEAARHSTPAAAPEQLAKAQSQAKQLLGDVRRVVTTLRQEPTVDFSRALAALGEGIDQPAIHRQVPEGFTMDDPERAHTLLRCAQEALTNCLRHARARNVWLTLEPRADEVELRVRDDGRGARAVSEGHGLAGMRERLGTLGGRLEAATSPGAGFDLRVSMPVTG